MPVSFRRAIIRWPSDIRCWSPNAADEGRPPRFRLWAGTRDRMASRCRRARRDGAGTGTAHGIVAMVRYRDPTANAVQSAATTAAVAGFTVTRLRPPDQ